MRSPAVTRTVLQLQDEPRSRVDSLARTIAFLSRTFAVTGTAARVQRQATCGMYEVIGRGHLVATWNIKEPLPRTG